MAPHLVTHHWRSLQAFTPKEIRGQNAGRRIIAAHEKLLSKTPDFPAAASCLLCLSVGLWSIQRILTRTVLGSNPSRHQRKGSSSFEIFIFNMPWRHSSLLYQWISDHASRYLPALSAQILESVLILSAFCCLLKWSMFSSRYYPHDTHLEF